MFNLIKYFFYSIFFLFTTSLFSVCYASDRDDLYTKLADPAAQKRLLQITKTPESNNKVTLIHRGDLAKATIFNLLNKAKKSIEIIMPYWYADYSGQQIVDRLEKIAKKGIKIKFINDSVSNFNIRNFFNAPNDSIFTNNNNIETWNTPSWHEPWSYKLFSNHIHEKLLIIDGIYLLAGGMNFAEQYLSNGRNSWHDDDVLIEGPAALEARAYFYKLWNIAKFAKSRSRAFPRSKAKHQEIMQRIFIDNPKLREAPLNNKYRLPNSNFISKYQTLISYAQKVPKINITKNNKVKHGKPVRVIIENPLADRRLDKGKLKRYSRIFETIKYVSEKATTRAWFMTPYLSLTKNMEDLLIAGAKTKEIIVITNSFESLDMTKRWLMAGAYTSIKRLINNNVKVFLWNGHTAYEDLEKKHNCFIKRSAWPGSTLHSKIALFDDSVSFIGSHNFNTRSEKFNSESSVMIRSYSFAKKVKKIFTDAILTEDLMIKCNNKILKGPKTTSQVHSSDLKKIKRKISNFLFRDAIIQLAKRMKFAM